MDKQQYISSLHEGFRSVVNSYLATIAFLFTQPQTTDEDKQALEQYKMMLKGKDVCEIEKSLLDGDVVKALDQISNFYKGLTDYALEHINESLIWKQIVRNATYQYIENEKNLAKKKYEELQ